MKSYIPVIHKDDQEERMSFIWAHWRDEAISRGITMDAVNHTFEQWFEGNIALLIDPDVEANKIWYMSTFKTLYRIGFNILLEHGISPETCYVNFQIIERDCPPGALITLKRAYGLDPTDTCPLRKE